MATGKETPVPPFLPSSNVMANGYFGTVTMEAANPNCVPVDQAEEGVSLRRSVDLGYITSTSTIIDNEDPRNKYKETEELILRESKPRYKDMSSQMKEYNVNYSGLVIIPWDEFAENPRKLNDLFYLERNGQITYDPDEVNVFFHASKTNKPTFGDISENGKAWVVNVESIRDLEQVRVWLIERVSVFGVTLVRKASRFGKSDRAPCLIMLDPTMGHSDAIHAIIMRCINEMQQGKKFCLEINLNGCVERWCRRITMTKCEAVGAKLVITNGEEPANLTDAENIVCCIVCFPIWSVQAGIYKLHRRAKYKDFELKFDAEEMFLHGTLGGVRNQRAKLFRDYYKEIFRTKPIDEAGPEFQGPSIDRHKLIMEKKSLKRGKSKEDDYTYTECEHTDIYGLSSKDNDTFNESVNKTRTQTSSFTEELDRINVHSDPEQIKRSFGGAEMYFDTKRLAQSDISRYYMTQTEEYQDLKLELGENNYLSDSLGNEIQSKNPSRINSFLEVESCTMKKELPPINSARTVNSDIMIITQSSNENSPDGSEIDLRTFLTTELSPPPEKPKKKKRKKDKRSSKPPKPPKKTKNIERKGVDNSAFDPENENKFRRILPSKRRSLESLDTIDTLESNDKLETGSSMDTLETGSRDSLDTLVDEINKTEHSRSENEVLPLKHDTENKSAILATKDNNSDSDNDNTVFKINNHFEHRLTDTIDSDKNEHLDVSKTNVVSSNDMSCDDLEFSDLDDDDQRSTGNIKHDTDTYKHISKANSGKKQTHMRGTAPYRSNRQKYIGMNTSVKNGRLPPLNTK